MCARLSNSTATYILCTHIPASRATVTLPAGRPALKCCSGSWLVCRKTTGTKNLLFSSSSIAEVNASAGQVDPRPPCNCRGVRCTSNTLLCQHTHCPPGIRRRPSRCVFWLVGWLGGQARVVDSQCLSGAFCTLCTESVAGLGTSTEAQLHACLLRTHIPAARLTTTLPAGRPEH